MSKAREEKNLIAQIKQAIQASGKSLYRIGKEANVGPDRLSRFMRGERSISLEAAEKICAALNLELTAKRPPRK